MDERTFFDRLAPEWDQNEVLSTPDRVNYVLDFLNIKEGQRILDLGTGTGVLIPYLAERIGKEGVITAVDYSSGMLAKAMEKFAGVIPTPQFLNLDFENETLPGVYDRIILYCVYPHLHTPVDTLKWLRAVNLAEGGTITIAFPTSPDFINDIHRQRHSDSDILPPAEELAKAMREQGLNARVLNADERSYIISIY